MIENSIYFVICCVVFFSGCCCCLLDDYYRLPGTLNDVNLTNKEGFSYSDSHVSSLSLNISCHELQSKFGMAVAQYSDCAVKNAHPIKICTGCVDDYTNMLSNYKDLKNEPNCSEILFYSDRLDILGIMHTNILNLWNTASCDGCFSDLNQKVNYSYIPNDIQNFFNAFFNIKNCLNVPVDLSNENKHCVRCNDSFHQLESNWEKVLKLQISPQSVCMDIEDAMNYTRRVWREYGCKKFDTNIGIINIIITTLLVLLPATFYTIARFISVIEVISIVQPKRRAERTQPKD